MGAEEFNPLEMLDAGQPDADTPPQPDTADHTATRTAAHQPTTTAPASTAPTAGTAAAATDTAGTAAQDPTGAASGTDDNAGDNTGDAATSRLSPGVYRRRQLTLVGGILAAIFAALLVNHTGVPGAAPSPAEQAVASEGVNAATVPGQSRARTDQDRALRHYRKTGSYRGFTPPGTRAAASEDIWAASRLTDGVCVMYAMEGDRRTDITVDPSGIACTDAEMAAMQASLDEQQQTQDVATQTEANDAFAHLGRTVVGYATTSYSAGTPTLKGLPATGLIDGLTITENHGTWVLAQYQSSAICLRASVAIDGTVSETTPC